MIKTIYTKVSNDRAQCFSVTTSIREYQGKRFVVKTPVTPIAMEHVQSLKKKYSDLNRKYVETSFMFAKIEKNFLNNLEDDSSVVVEYIEGKRFSSYLDRLLEEGNTELFYEEIQKYFDVLLMDEQQFEGSDEFENVFGDVVFPAGTPAVRMVDIDTLFDNVIYKNDNWIDYDYEWTFDFLIPVKYVIFRILNFYVARSEKRLIMKDGLFIKYGLDKDKIAIFEKMEESFQKYVYGNTVTMFNLYNDIHGENVYICQCENERQFFSNLVDMKEKHIRNIENINKELQHIVEQKENHIKNIENMNKDLTRAVNQKENHINNIEKKDEILEKRCQQLQKENLIMSHKLALVYKGIKNPFYGGYLLSKKVAKKIKNSSKIKYDKKYQWLREEQGNREYEKWIVNRERTYDTTLKFSYNPKISVIVPVYNVLDKHLIPCIESVRNQIYTNWELCLADDASTWPNVKTTLQKYENEEKIKIIYRSENGHISKCTNSAMEAATGEFIAFLDCDDVLRPNALYEVVKKLNEDPELDYIYSDEDKIDNDGNNRHMPHFKPDWSPDTLLSLMYTCHLSVYRKKIADEIGGLRTGFEGSQDYDFALRFTEKTDKIAHIPKILYHWRERDESTAASADAKPYIIEATRKAKEEALSRRHIDGRVVQLGGSNWFRIIYSVTGNPKVSILIPSKDNFEIFARCVKSIYEITAYKNFEIVLVDNGSNDENKKKYELLADNYGFIYHYEKMDFNFSKMCNIAASIASGEFYLLLNDDTEVLEPEWMERMLGQAQQKHTGAVGAKLLYPNSDIIQHIGVINIKPGPIHAFTKCSDKESLYFERNRLDYNYIAVTAACMMVSKEKYDLVGGFEENLAVAFNDVDFCYKLLEHGYFNVVRMDAVLVHHESISRGNDLLDDAKMKRLSKERDKLYERHPLFVEYDPFYNVNLCQDDVDFSNGYTTAIMDDNHIEVLDSLYRQSDKVNGYIDTYYKTESLFFEGWAFIHRYKKNNDIDVKLLIYNDDNIYEISTRKVYRQDVADAIQNEKNIEYTGFRCKINKNAIKPGKYKVAVVCNKLYKDVNLDITL